MTEKFFKLSKYFNDCYCGKKREPFIVKYDAAATGTGIGTTDTIMLCPLCKRRRTFRINTWWGGYFKDSDYIFLDTAKKTKFKVSDAEDMTKSLLIEHIKTLDRDVLNKKNELKKSEENVKQAKIILDRIDEEEKEAAKEGKGKKKNG